MSSEGAALRDRVRRSRSSSLFTMLSTHCLFVVAFAGLSGVALAQGSGSMVRVSCEGASAGAAVTINGKFKGDCPLDAEVPAGTVELRAIKAVDAERERVFFTSFGIGDGVVKRVEVQLGPTQLNEAGRRAAAERQRIEDERKRAEAEARRKEAEAAQAREAERLRLEAQRIARETEWRRLATVEATERHRARAVRTTRAFAAAGLQAGTGAPFRDCADCPEMVWIPPGRAAQLPTTTDSQRWFNETEILAPLAVGKFEVTFAEWDACVAQGGCSRRPDEGKSEGLLFDSSWGRGRQPVMNVSKVDAEQFVAWLSRKTGQRYRLLSLAEFGYASRAGATTLFPWGDKLDAGAAHCKGCGGRAKDDRPAPVGSFAANAWGLHDMVGNVFEWTTDCLGRSNSAERSFRDLDNWARLKDAVRDGRPVMQCAPPPAIRAGDPPGATAEARAQAARLAARASGQEEAGTEPLHAVAGASWMTGVGAFIGLGLVKQDTTSVQLGLRVAREFTPPLPPPPTALSLQPVRDCADCPELILLPAGRFEMGSETLSLLTGVPENQAPRRDVDVAAFAIGRFEVTRGQYAAFVRETAYAPVPGCQAHAPDANDPNRFLTDPSRTWADPGFAQGDDHPVTCVNRADALAYLDWLGKKTGQRYRLPSEAEWEYAARAGTDIARPWGVDRSRSCEFANLRGSRSRQASGSAAEADCDDVHMFTAPVGRFQANAWGLHDVLGNVMELVEDCWFSSHAGAPPDARARLRDGCLTQAARGGSWFTAAGAPIGSLFARGPLGTDIRGTRYGFRVARDPATPAQ